MAEFGDLRRAISENGEYVVFSSAEQLQADAHDVNKDPNIYLWHNGTVSLIADGTNPEHPDEPPAISASGSDVFFATTNKLVGQDTDNLQDIYDARISGGFPAPTPEPSCSGEECQGALSSSFVPIAPGSSTQAAVGNLTPPLVTSTEPKPKSLTVMITKAKLEGNAVSVSVKTSAKGNVRISGKYLKTTSKTVAAGTHTITVALTKAGRAAMKHHKKTTVRVSLTVGKQVVAKSVTVKL